jgi:hypothetical protein
MMRFSAIGLHILPYKVNSLGHPFLLGLYLVFFTAASLLAEPNYVYHEATTNNPGCGANNYRSVLVQASSQGLSTIWHDWNPNQSAFVTKKPTFNVFPC